MFWIIYQSSCRRQVKLIPFSACKEESNIDPIIN